MPASTIPPTPTCMTLRIYEPKTSAAAGVRDGPDALVESADVIEQRANGNQRAAEHQAGLNQVRPDDGLDSAERRIEAGDEGEGDDRDEIGTDRRDRLLAELHLSARDEHAVRQHHHERGDEEPRSRRH